MQEGQNIEFKRVWKDECLKCVSAFANSDGGVLYIGLDDNGKIIGVENPKRLLEEIPNKTQNLLGVVVNAKLEFDKVSKNEYLRIEIEKYPYPVSYKGAYYRRSGSAVMEIKGGELDKFLLSKQGKKWDGVAVPNLKFEDLDSFAFKLFREKAMKKRRIDADFLQDDDEMLLEKLHLKEDKYLKQATTLLFAKDPQKFITGSHIKIGFFETDSELIYQDIIEGNLFAQIDKAMDLVFSKYLKAVISYEGLQRVESFPLSELAFREALTNAVVHKDYASQFDIQIKIYKDKLLIWNAGDLPSNWSVKTLLQKHSSQPHNPTLAYVFFLAGYIESWGRGIEKIIAESKNFNKVIPKFKWENGLCVEFALKAGKKAILKDDGLGEKLGDRLGEKLGDKFGDVAQNIIKIMQKDPHISIKSIAHKLKISTTAIEKHIKTLKNKNAIKRVGSTKAGHWEVIK